MSTKIMTSEETDSLSGHEIVSRVEWLVARRDLLKREKELARLRDQLSAQRRALPWVKIDKRYVFNALGGELTLADLFTGRSQLIIYHFMFHPDWKEGCPSCSFVSDHLDGARAHLAARDVTLTMVSRAPLAKIEAFKKRMGWHFKWVSSFGSDFNFDYHVSFAPEQKVGGKVDYNYTMQEFPSDEGPGLSVFYKDPISSEIFHTYSTFARGLDPLVGTYTLLDLVPKGRDEDDLAFSMQWVRHHDRYGTNLFLDETLPYWPPTASPESSTCPCAVEEVHT
jgi:predicted dithiol-disulfide oxidoreductase (DUF899 family)